MELTPEQLRIVQASRDINMIITACPGSGKTTTIIYRVLYLINVFNVNPKDIYVFTYSHSLGQELRLKFESLGLNKKLGWCKTLHSYCYKETYSHTDLTKWIELHKEEEFDDKPKDSYLFFDEYQDADEHIRDVLKILSEDNYLTIIGDERQQLYKFRGADASYLKLLKPDFKSFTLTKSFRCNQNICKLLSRLFNDTVVSNVDGPKPFLYRCKTKHLHNSLVINEIVNIVRNNKFKSIAVLSPVDENKTHLFLNDLYSNLSEIIPIDRVSSRQDRFLTSQSVVSTIHQSKGKEYDVVILLLSFESCYTYNCQDINDLCKFYVACSRAKEQLHVFENRHYKTYSLKYVYDNSDLFDMPSPPFSGPPALPGEETGWNQMKQITITEYIKYLTEDEKNYILNKWSEQELVFSEDGCDVNVKDNLAFGLLIEHLLAVKILKQTPTPIIGAFVTSNEADKIPYQKKKSKNMNITIGLAQRLVSIFKGSISDTDLIKLMRGITGRNFKVVSKLIVDKYSESYPLVSKISSQITDSFEAENIKRIWEVAKFNFFVNTLNYPDFIKINFQDDVLLPIKEYLKKTKALESLNIRYYHDLVSGKPPNIPSQKTNKTLENISELVGEVDFSGPDFLLEVKCINGNIDDAFVQVALYAELAGSSYSTIYVYNARDGNLFMRKRLVN
jgi:hypothetical protein